MPSKSVIRNIEILQDLTRGSKEDVRDRVNQVVEFYRDRKISQVETAKNLIKSLKSDNKRTATFAKKRFDKKFEQIEGRAPLNERMATNRDKKDYVVRFQLYGEHTREGGNVAFTDNQGGKHSLLRIPQPIQLNLKNVRDEDKLDETLVGKYVLIDKFDRWVKSLKYRLKLKKGNPNKITRKEFDKLNTREEWRKETGIDETPLKRRRRKDGGKEFEVIHDTALFDKLFKRLVEKHPDLKNNPNLEDYTSAIKILDITDVSNTGGNEDETKRKLKDGNEIGMYHYTINTEMDVSSDNLVDAIKNKKHTDGECWINTLIDHYEETLMDNKKWESKRMTRDKVLKLMNLNEEDFKVNGASVEDMERVFEEFKLTVRLYNYIGQKIYSYDPDKKNKNVNVLFGLIKGNHIYTMNDNIKSIAQRELEEDMKLNASTDFHLNSKEKPVKYDFFNGIDDIMGIVEANEDTEEEVNLVSGKNLNTIFCEFKRAKYEPKIIMGAGGNVASLKVKFNKLILNIRSQTLIDCAVDTSIGSSGADMFNKVNEAFFNFNKGMFNPNHKSYYNNDDLKIFSIAHSIAPSGYFESIIEGKDTHIELDRRKAYTKSTTDVLEVPCFSEFDIWKKYDYSKNDFNKMNALTLYLVKSRIRNMFFNRTYNLIYGKFLKKYYDDVEVIYYKIPSNTYKVNYKKLINELWELKLDEDEEKDKMKKKMIACINIGLLEKQTNTAKKSIVFSKLVDAFYYQEKYGGDINIITETKWDGEVYDDDEDCLIEFDDKGNVIEPENDEKELAKIVDECKHYVLNISDTKTLMNGYKYVKELILQHDNFDMNEAYETLMRDNVMVYSVKTDAFVIDKCNLGKARDVLKFGSEIGDWRWSDKFNFPSKAFCKQPSILCDITEYENKTGDVKDEWNTDEIIDEHILNSKRLMIRAEFAGSGKSYICKHLKTRNYRVLFVVHSNELGQQCGCEWTTINKFFGISFGDERLTKFDYSVYDVIVFDEIYFHNVGKWALIWDFCKNNPEIIVATGDTNQLKNPERVSNVISFEKYADHCINLIFKNNIMLYECKRLKTEEDRHKLRDVKRMIFEGTPFREIIDNYFKWTDKIEMYDNNIAYTNNTCKMVSSKIREMKNITEEYGIGEEVICRKYIKTMGTKFNVNFKFRISNIVGDIVVLQNVATNEKQNIKIELLRKHFIYAYCYTAHSKQGCSVDGDIVIYDWNEWYVSKNWFFTALTRATDFNKIKFFKYNKGEESKSKRIVEQYFERKVLNYIEQDKRAGRDVEGNAYVDVDFLMNLMNTQCENCNEPLVIDFEDGKVSSNISCQRVNCCEAHFKDNCKGYCVSCNCAFSNKILM